MNASYGVVRRSTGHYAEKESTQADPEDEADHGGDEASHHGLEEEQPYELASPGPRVLNTASSRRRSA